ncbi:MAG: Rieske (2Fe-2S) protein [Verrucomicrobia bacterium]|nr:Rieske (2Fe-2S) protein [Verrucomicrobiota bacterium]
MNHENENPKPCNESKPCACSAAPAPEKSTRREFMLKIGFGLNAIAGAAVGIPLLGYALSSFFKGHEIAWVSLGPVDKFPEGKTRLGHFKNPVHRSWDGVTAEIPCWVRRISGDQFQVFAINCAHLGCPVRWFEQSKLFMCPCHGGAYYENGDHAAGPPPRGLFTYEFKVQDGQLLILAGALPTLAQPNA